MEGDPIVKNEPTNRPDLRQVTLCAVDSVTPELAGRALKRCLDGCDFGAAKLFTDKEVVDRAYETVPVEKMVSRDAYSQFILKGLAAHIQTPFVLIVQWDGFVVGPPAWRENFLECDLIGARWPWHADGMTVGNGGFSLRSKRLIDLISSDEFPLITSVAEDELICRLYRSALIRRHGIKFASEAVADAFSYERVEPDAPTFGFHGLFNMWRHLDDEEMISTVAALTRSTIRSQEYFELLAAYIRLRKFPVVGRLFRRLRTELPPNKIREEMVRHYGNDSGYAFCERAATIT